MKTVKFMLFVILLAFLCAAPVYAGEADKKKKENVIFVPYEEIDKVLGPGNRGVLLDAAEYRRLRALAKKNAAKEDAPRDLVFRKAEYEGRLEKEQIIFHAKFTIDVLRRGWIRAPLWFAGIALTGVTLDGKKARLRASGEHLVELLTDRRGEAVLEADFRVRVSTIPSGRYVTALLPEVAVSTVRLKLPGRLEVKTTPPLVETKYGGADNATTTTAIVHLGASRRFSFFFRGEERAAERRPVIVSHQATLYTVKDRLLTADAAIELEIFRAPVRKFTMTVPEGLNLAKLEIEHLLSWEAGAAKDGRVPVTVELRKPLEGSGKLHIVGERILRNLGDIGFPRISLEGAERETALLGIAVRKREKLQIAKSDGLRRIEARGLIAPPSGLTVVRAYRASEPSGAFTLSGSVEPETKRVTAETLVLADVCERSLSYVARVRFKTERGQVFRFTASCPKAWKVHSVSIKGAPGAAEHNIRQRENDQAIVIDLAKHPKRGAHFDVIIEAKDEAWKDVPKDGSAFALPVVRAENVDDQTGYVGLVCELSLELSTSEEKELREEDAQSDAFLVRFEKIVNLAFSFKQKPYSATVSVKRRTAQVTATTLTTLTPSEDLLKVHHLLRYTVSDAGIRGFDVVLPAGTGENVDFKCRSFRSATRGKTEEGKPEKWTIHLSDRVSGDLPVQVSCDVPLALGNRFEAPKVTLAGVVRQMGYILVEAGEEMEIVVWPSDLVSLDAVRVPPELCDLSAYRPKRSVIFAFNYIKPTHKLEMEIMKHPFANVLTGIVLASEFASVVSTGGDARTRARYRIGTKPGQSLAISLPDDSTLWSVRVDDIPVKVGKYRGKIDEKVRDWRIIPLGVGSRGKTTTYTLVELLYNQPVSRMGTSGSIELGAPELPDDLHVLTADWNLYLPSGYQYSGFSGNLAHDGAGERLVLPHVFRGIIARPWLFIGLLVGLIVIIGIVMWVRIAHPDIKWTGPDGSFFTKRIGLSRTMISLFIIVAILAIIAAIAIPSLLTAKISGHESSVIASLRTLSSTQEQYRARYGRYATLHELAAANFIDPVLGSGQKSGYVLNVQAGKNTWVAGAIPQVPGETGVRGFRIDQSGVISYTIHGFVPPEASPSLGGEAGDLVEYRVIARSEGAPYSDEDIRLQRELERMKMKAGEEGKEMTLPWAHMPKPPRAVTVTSPGASLGRRGKERAEGDYQYAEKPQAPPADSRAGITTLPARGTIILKNDGGAIIDGKILSANVFREWKRVRMTDVPWENTRPRKKSPDVWKSGYKVFTENQANFAGEGYYEVPDGSDQVTAITGGVRDTLLKPQNVDRLSKLVHLAGDDIKGGVASLALDIDRIGRTESFHGRFGAKTLGFWFTDSTAYWVLHVLVSLAAFGAGIGLIFFVPKLRTPVILFGLVLFTMLPQVLGSWFVAVSNALVVGLVGSAVVGILAWFVRLFGRKAVTAVLVAGVVVSFCIMPCDTLAKGKGRRTPAPPPPQQEQKPEEDKIYIPYHPEEFGKWAELERTGKVLIPYGLYRELYRLAYPDRPGILPVDAGKPFISAAEYSVTLEEKRIEITASLEIEALADGTHTIDLGLAGVPIASALLDGKPAKLKTTKQGNLLIFSGRGTKKLVLTFALKAPKTPRSGTFSFRIPRTPQTVLVLTTEIPDLEIEVPTAFGGQHETIEEKRTTVKAYLGTSDLVRVNWKPKAKATTAARARYTVRTSQVVTIADGMVHSSVKFDFALGTMEVERFLIDLPENFKVLAVEGGNMRLWRTVKGENVRRLEVILHSPAKKRFELSVRGETPLPAGLGKTALPLLTSPSARRESGSIRLTVPAEITLTLGRQENVTRLSSSARTSPGSPREYRFSYDATPIALETVLVERPVKLRGVVRTLVGVTEDTVEAASFVMITPKGRGILTAEIEAPADFEITSVRGPHVAEHDVVKTKDKQLVKLQLSRRLFHATYVLLRMRRLLEKTEGTDSFALPRVAPAGVDRPDGEIYISHADGMELYFSGIENLRQVDPHYMSYFSSCVRGLRPALAFKFNESDYRATIHIRRLESTAEATVNLLGLVVGESLKVNALIDYTVRNARQKVFSFTFPKEIAKKLVPEIAGANIRSKTVSEDGTQWTVTLQSGVLGRYALSVSFEIPLEIPGTLDAFPFVNASGVTLQRSYVVMKNLGEARVYAVPQAGIEEIPPDEYPYALEAVDLVGVWRATSPAPALKFELTQPERVAGAEISIPRALITTIVGGDGTAYYEASYLVENTARQFLGVKLPEGADLWAVAVEKTTGRLEPVKPAVGKDDSILIPLPKLTRGDLAFEVVVLFALKLGGVGGIWSSPELPAPEVVGVPQGTVKATYWDLTLPDKVTFTGFSGNVDPSLESDIARADLSAFMQEQDRIENEIRQAKSIDERLRLTKNFQYALARAQGQSAYLELAARNDYRNPDNLGQGKMQGSDLSGNKQYNWDIQRDLRSNDAKSSSIISELQKQAAPAPMTNLPLAVNGLDFVKAYAPNYSGRQSDNTPITGKKNFNDIGWTWTGGGKTFIGSEVLDPQILVAYNYRGRVDRDRDHDYFSESKESGKQMEYAQEQRKLDLKKRAKKKQASRLRSNLAQKSQQMKNKQSEDLKRNRRIRDDLNELSERQDALENKELSAEEEKPIVTHGLGVGGGAAGTYGQRFRRTRRFPAGESKDDTPDISESSYRGRPVRPEQKPVWEPEPAEAFAPAPDSGGAPRGGKWWSKKGEKEKGRPAGPAGVVETCTASGTPSMRNTSVTFTDSDKESDEKAVLPEGVSVEQVDVSTSFQKRSGVVSLPVSVRHMVGRNRFFFRRLASGTPTLSVSYRAVGVEEWFASLVRLLALAAIFAAAVRMKASFFGKARPARWIMETAALALLVLITAVSSVAAVVVFVVAVGCIVGGPRLLHRVA